MSAFEELGICPEIVAAAEAEGWLLPTPVQQEAIPYILNGKDVCAAAETGSGKTGAFALPIVQIVHEALRHVADIKIRGLRETGGSGALLVNEKVNQLNAEDKDAFVLVSNDKGEARTDDKNNWCGIRGHAEVVGGMYQFEVDVMSPGLCRIGWSLGIAKFALGTDDRGWGFGGTGKKSWNNKFEDYGETFGKGDTIGCLIDRKDTHTISFHKNGRDLGVAFRLPPQMAGGLKPHMCGKGFYTVFRTKNLRYPAEGYKPLSELSAEDSGSSISVVAASRYITERSPLCIMLEPTRDLANQTYASVCKFAHFLESPKLRALLCVGGVNDKSQRISLQEGVDIVVGTLSRVSGWINSGEISLRQLRFLVLDEADELLQQDDQKIIPRIKSMALQAAASDAYPLQTLFFSATLHGDVVKAAVEQLTRDAVWVDLKGHPSLPSSVHAVVMKVMPDISRYPQLQNMLGAKTDGIHDLENRTEQDRMSSIIKLLKPKLAIHIADKLHMETCMIFCRTNVDCDNMEQYLIALGGNQQFKGRTEGGKENPYSCVVLAGLRDQSSRTRALQHFKSGDVRFLICTDVAARGIDISELPFVVMMNLPDEADQFVHRVGRVGRADRMGMAIALVSSVEERVWYHKCKNRGQGCRNTKLTNSGGCTIWFQEPQYLTNIQELLLMQLPEMNPETLEVPGILQFAKEADDTKADATDTDEFRKERMVISSIKAAGEDVDLESMLFENTTQKPPVVTQGGVVYGQARRDPAIEESKKRVTQIRPNIMRLLDLEQQLQATFAANRGLAHTA